VCTRELNGEPVEFGTTGYTMDSIFVLYDRASDSVWYPRTAGTLNAVAGARKGDAIEILDEPAPEPLGLWLDEHPDSLILIPSPADLARMNRAVLGVRLDESDRGVLLSGVGEGSAADKAGLVAGDLILWVGGAEVLDGEELRQALGQYRVGDSVVLLVEHQGERREVEVTFEGRD